MVMWLHDRIQFDLGGCSSMVERRTVDAVVAGSIPVSRPSTPTLKTLHLCAGFFLAQIIE
jgi:hypothetical protein